MENLVEMKAPAEEGGKSFRKRRPFPSDSESVTEETKAKAMSWKEKRMVQKEELKIMMKQETLKKKLLSEAGDTTSEFEGPPSDAGKRKD